jgi:predicted RND superfamily exporter protein
VVNNAIVLVSYTNLLRQEQGYEIVAALQEAGRSRLRPILMTTLTTVLSLMPMAIGFGGEVEMMRSMAIAVIGGLAFSTILVLYLVPVVYLIFDSEKYEKRLERRRERRRRYEEQKELAYQNKLRLAEEKAQAKRAVKSGSASEDN